MGTQWQIDTIEQLSASARASIAAVVEDYDRGFSRFRSDSAVRRAALPGQHELPGPAAQLEPLYRSLYRLTSGAMTPLVAESLEHLGYGAEYSLRPGPGFHAAPAWSDAIDWRGTSLQTKLPVVLDLGGAGKGQLVDLIGDELAALGIPGSVIDASGDLRVRGLPAERVALEHPYAPEQAIGVVELVSGALCGSASNRRAWGDGLHHVLDGATGKPVQTVVASWAMAESAMLADGLATALFFVDHDVLATEFDFASVRVFSDGRAETSANFNGEIFQ
ncbi:FAD:protein FMN transferase [Arthrobacter russicus]|uniref:FAD:protein FMN transferase n=1 Tax=Arthrobacter russicus TaxID=172040 RepID=UPI00286D5A17|nr:FAD:protein FMN transferase [Arthrobacter russicus]